MLWPVKIVIMMSLKSQYTNAISFSHHKTARNTMRQMEYIVTTDSFQMEDKTDTQWGEGERTENSIYILY